MSAQDMILIKKAVNGDEQAFESLLSQYQNRIYSIALRMLGNEHDALDATQDTLIRIYKNIGKFKGNSSFSTWVYRIAENSCFDLLNLNKKPVRQVEKWGDAPEVAAQGPGPEEIVLERESVSEIYALILKLSDIYRAALVLRDVEGFAYEEIALILNISVGTVKSRIARARNEMRKLLLQNQIID